MKQKKYLTALLGLYMAGTAGAQTLTQAKNFFEQGEFEKANPYSNGW